MKRLPPCIELYTRAWVGRDAALLKECFAADAVYMWRPEELSTPLRGLHEIEAYWKNKVIGETSEVELEIVRSLCNDREVWLEWKCVTQVPALLPGDSRFPMWGSMILDLDETGKITKLTEYYFWDNEQRRRLEEARDKKRQLESRVDQ